MTTGAEAREQATVEPTNKMPVDSPKPVKHFDRRQPRPALKLEAQSRLNNLSSGGLEPGSAYTDVWEGHDPSPSLDAKQAHNGVKNPRTSRHFYQGRDRDRDCDRSLSLPLPAPDKQPKFSSQSNQSPNQTQRKTRSQTQAQAYRQRQELKPPRHTSYAASGTSKPKPESEPESQQPPFSPTRTPAHTIPSPSPSPSTGKLTSKARSTSYTSPLPLFQTDESKLKSGKAAPLTEQNLRSHLRSLNSSPAISHRPNFGEALAEPPPSFPRPVPVSATSAPAPQGAAVPTTSQFHTSTFLTGGMRKSRSPKKHDKDRDKDKKKSKPDPNTHPLNLPPDQLRQLFTAQMARQEAEAARSSMSMDRDTPEASEQTFVNGSSPPATPSKEAPGAFPDHASDHSTDGTNASDERSPTPPPHKVTPVKVDPEACKAAGNKFFKAKDYDRAIAEYTKGMPC